MTPEELSKALAALGWRQSDLARKIDAHPNTVSAWATGKTPIPGVVKAYLTLLLDFRKLRDFVDKRLT